MLWYLFYPPAALSDSFVEVIFNNSERFFLILTLPASFISERFVKIKINLSFYFYTSCGVSKDFMKALKAFINPFEAPQRSVKLKIWVDFLSFPSMSPSIPIQVKNILALLYFWTRNIYLLKLIFWFLCYRLDQ